MRTPTQAEVHLTNLLALRETIERLRKLPQADYDFYHMYPPQQEYLDFNVIFEEFQDCRTFGCLAGYYCLWNGLPLPTVAGLSRWSEENFGLRRDEADDIFGGNDSGDLDARARIVEELIAERQK